MERMEEQMETTTPSKYEGLGAAMAAEVMIGFWFGIGVILAVRMIASLDKQNMRLLLLKWQNKLRGHFYQWKHSKFSILN